MLEITTPNSPARVVVSERHARLVINCADYALVVCLVCGGTKSITLHTLPGHAEVPSVFACYCDKPSLLSAQEDAYAAALQ